MMGLTDIEACFYADISRTTLHNYQTANPEFLDRKEALKEAVKARAKINLSSSIIDEGNVADSKWYLERKDKEFSPKQDHEHTGDIKISIEKTVHHATDNDKL